MQLLNFQKVKDGKYLKNYELTYLNKAGKEKKYEMVSRRELNCTEDIGKNPSGVSIVATCQNMHHNDAKLHCDAKLLLLHEFRMGVNKTIYNLCAGMIEPGESIEDCISRELYEETGLKVKKIKKILPPSFAAVAISDTMTYIAFVEIDETSLPNEASYLENHSSDNEQIEAAFYTRDEVKKLLETEPFSSRAQMAAYFFAEQVQL